MQRKRGRSVTVRRDSTNSQTSRKEDVYPWWRQLAIGDSSWAFAASFLLLLAAFGVSTLVDDCTGENLGNGNAWSRYWQFLNFNQIHVSGDCRPDPNAVPALMTGDLDKLFQRIISLNASDPIAVSAKQPVQKLVVSVRHRDPWIVTLDDFLSSEEAYMLVKHGYGEGFHRSVDFGGTSHFNGKSVGKVTARRTSETSWCASKTGCRGEKIPRRIHQRISNLLDIPEENSEDFQVLKYDVGQYYKPHHDYIPHQKERQCGPRILTFFMYLSDVSSGGGTRFPQLNVTIEPRKGRALLFPNVMNSDPLVSDHRMYHEALPVQAGTKFAANGWIHMYDYQGAFRNGCN